MRVLASVLLLAVCPAGVDVRSLGPGRVAINVKAVPLGDVLECVSQKTGFKIVYDGVPVPRQLVTAAVADAPVSKAVEGLLEAQGLNYAMGVDPKGKGPGLLMISSAQTSVVRGGG